MKQWYYIEDGEQQGPITTAQISNMFKSGKIASETLVWTDGQEDWCPASDVDGLIPSPNPVISALFQPTPTQPAAANPAEIPDITESVPEKHTPTGNQIRPWVRYWARIIDFSLFCMVAGAVLALVYEPVLDLPETIFGIMLLLLYIVVEPAMLASMGTTPGKALLKIRLRDSNGRKLSYSAALIRSFKVALYGEGLGIPLIALITQINAYNRLTNRGITSWDEAGNFRLTHRIIGAGRMVAVILVIMTIVFIMVLGNTDV